MVVKEGVKFSHISAMDLLILLQKYSLTLNDENDIVVITTTSFVISEAAQNQIDLIEDLTELKIL